MKTSQAQGTLGKEFWDAALSPRSLRMYILALVVRLILIAYGEWQDANNVDYFVFTDAARYVTQHQSPYLRSTYRYTPLLAYLLTPNIYVHKSFGKLLFTLTDLTIGLLLHAILFYQLKKRTPDNIATQDTLSFYVASWLFNPIVVNVSTRGNAESLVSFLVLATLYFIFVGNITLGAIIYGLSVHFKIYPIIYGLPLFFYLRTPQPVTASKRTNAWDLSWLSFNRHQIKFFVISAGTFLGTTAVMYAIYGQPFLEETYLYHIWRKDIRHSFSVYFYSLYLSSTTPAAAATATTTTAVTALLSKAAGLLAFVPQIFLVILCFTYKYYQDITFCMFIQTLGFVAFNKVCTVQYFVWYFSLLPLALPTTTLSKRQGLLLFASWLGSQLLWLFSAYRLEFLGLNTFLDVWLAGLLFFAVNIWIIISFINHHKPLHSLKLKPA